MVKPATSICRGRCRNKDHGIGVEGKGIHALGNCLLGTMRGVKKRMCNPCGKAALTPILVCAHDARGHAFKHTCRKAIVRAFFVLARFRLAFCTEKTPKRRSAAQAGKDGVDGHDARGAGIAHQSPRVLAGHAARGRQKLKRRVTHPLPRRRWRIRKHKAPLSTMARGLESSILARVNVAVQLRASCVIYSADGVLSAPSAPPRGLRERRRRRRGAWSSAVEAPAPCSAARAPPPSPGRRRVTLTSPEAT